MAEVERARRVLENERKAVMDELKAAAEEWKKVRACYFEAETKMLKQAQELLLRGRAAGMTVVQMANTFGMTRQRAHVLLREADIDQIREARDA